MQKVIKIVAYIASIIFSATLFAAAYINDDYSTGSIANRTGTVIRFMLNDNGIWTATTHGTTSHLFWETAPSMKIRIQGLPNDTGKYELICPELQYLNSGETISVLVRNVTEERDFYCEVEPVVD